MLGSVKLKSVPQLLTTTNQSRAKFFYSSNFFAESCSDELGMQNKRIANERITASSSKSTDNSPHFARLDGSKAWCSALYDKLPYIQIQLEEPKIITEIITQRSSYHWAWATKYEARFLENGKWKEYNQVLGVLYD